MNRNSFIPSPAPDAQAARTKLLPFATLYLRFSLGLWLLNGGLAVAIQRNGPGGPPVNRFTVNGLVGVLPGMEPLMYVLPYVELAVGCALILGIFTTIAALTACAISLSGPLLTSFKLVTQIGVNPFGNPFEFAGMFMNHETLSYAALVILSPQATNAFSIDALIFRRPDPSLIKGVEQKEPDAEA